MDETFSLPDLNENRWIPDNRDEVPSPDMIALVPHLQRYSNLFPHKDWSAPVGLLLGRDSGDLMLANTDQTHSPFVYTTPLGYAAVGALPCRPALKTCSVPEHSHFQLQPQFDRPPPGLLFHEFEDDEMLAPSPKDVKFLERMGNLTVNSTNHLQVGLPFIEDNPILPDNRRATFLRQRSTLRHIQRDPIKLEKCKAAMQKNIDRKDVSPIPKDEIYCPPGKAWYLSIFAVENEQKNKTRLVFDSRAEKDRVSLNKKLMTGPSDINQLRDVITRFREGPIAYISDIESMFHSFHVPPEDSNFLRFYWWKNNSEKEPIIPYRAHVHVFGNTSSPAVATYCLRKAAETGPDFIPSEEVRPFIEPAQKFINDHFYIDDGLGAAFSVSEAVGTLKAARQLLSRFNIRLHKILSNKTDLVEAFPESERAQDTQVLMNYSPTHRTLGLMWDLAEDVLRINIRTRGTPHTPRGCLSYINGVFDPPGLVQPCILHGKILMRKILQASKLQGDIQWDKSLGPELRVQWENWLISLEGLELLKIPRAFYQCDKDQIGHVSLHIFVDASQVSIGIVAYLRVKQSNGSVNVSFICGESKIAPKISLSIPRMELCACTQGSAVKQRIFRQLKIKPHQTFLYSDSIVALSYIANEEHALSNYVQRRVDKIRKSSDTGEWFYIESSLNPADLASRPTNPHVLNDSTWFTGPGFLQNETLDRQPFIRKPTLITLPDILSETRVLRSGPAGGLFDLWTSQPTRWFKSWTATRTLVSRLLSVAKLWLRKARRSLSARPLQTELGAPQPRVELNELGTPSAAQAEEVLIRAIQRAAYSDLLQPRALPPKDHRLIPLAPFVGDDGILRVGGRLRLATFPENLKHPILLPPSDPAVKLLAQHIHDSTNHQGRYITLASIRQRGYHIEGLSRFVAKMVRQCITCRKLRAQMQNPIMADLPVERLQSSPPFTSIAIDVMGPWHVSSGPQTRRNAPRRKVWALVATCMASRAVHIETLDSMDTTTFINAMKRIISIRGPVRKIFSDQGSNFVGAKNQPDAFDPPTMERNVNAVEKLGISWTMNPPYSSHWAGVVERKNGLIRRCMDSTMLHIKLRPLSAEELRTLLMEAAYIVNSTPLWATSSDPNEPLPLSPNMLLTQKVDAPSVEEVLNEQDLLQYGPKRWKKIQVLADIFWSNWRTHYLSQFHERSKWTRAIKPPAVGDVVLVKDDSTARTYWPIARVTETHISHDGVVRKVSLRMARTDLGLSPKEFTRPVSKILTLLASSASETTRTSQSLT